MIKNFHLQFLFLLTLSSAPLCAMEDLIAKTLWEATILAQQEEFKQALVYFVEQVTPMIDLFANQKKKFAKTEFLQIIEGTRAHQILFENIQNYYTVATIIRDRKLIEKKENYTPEDKRIIQRYLKSNNNELRSFGEILNISSLIDEAVPVAIKGYMLLAKFLTKFTKPYAQVPQEFKASMQKDNLLPLAQAVVKILPPWFKEREAILHPEESVRHVAIAEQIVKKYNESYPTINNRYTAAVKTIRSLPPLQEHFYEYISIGNLEWKPFPASLDEITVPEIIREEQKVALMPEPKKPEIPARKPKRKKKPARKPKKPIEKVTPPTIEEGISEPEIETEPEIEQAIKLEEAEPTYPELARWYNENFKTTDGSSVSYIDDYQITIEDPKNNAQVIIYRKSQDDKKIMTPPLNYIERVEQWFMSPQKALAEGGYTTKFKALKKLDEMAARHNFAQMVDAFIDKEGVSETYIDEKKRKIPVKLLAGELRLKQPGGSVDTISGIFSYGKLPKTNKYYHRYLHEKEYGKIAQEYYADAKWQVEFPPLS